jgi:hypothetical protein
MGLFPPPLRGGGGAVIRDGGGRQQRSCVTPPPSPYDGDTSPETGEVGVGRGVLTASTIYFFAKNSLVITSAAGIVLGI